MQTKYDFIIIGGGYIFGVMLVPDVPPAQAVAAFDTAMEVGRYPIC